jgi:hypothetical protein
MKPKIFLVILTFLFAACVSQPSIIPVKLTITPQATKLLFPTATITALPPLVNIGTNPAPTPISLSPIHLGNVHQVEKLFAYNIPSTKRASFASSTMSLSPDGNWLSLASTSEIKIIPLSWTSDRTISPEINLTLIKTYPFFYPFSLTFSPDSTQLAISGYVDFNYPAIEIIDLQHPDNIKTFNQIELPTAVAFTKDGNKLIVGTRSDKLTGSLQLWDIKTARIEREISHNSPSGAICSIEINYDAEILAAGYCTYVFDIRTWSIDNFAPIARLAGLDEVPWCSHMCDDNRNIIAFNPSTGDIASGTNYERIPIQNSRSGKLIMTISTQNPETQPGYYIRPVNALAFTQDGSILAISADNQLQLRDTKNGNLLWVYEEPNDAQIPMVMNTDARLIITSASNGDIEFWGVPNK